MAAADITTAEILDYIHEVDSVNTVALVERLRAAAMAFIRSHCNVDDDYINAHDDFDAVVMVLIADMYDTRSYRVDNDKINPFVASVLAMHDFNLAGD